MSSGLTSPSHLVTIRRVGNIWQAYCHACDEVLSKHEFQWNAESAAGEHRYATVKEES